ncbi:hypothetical protein HDV00_006546 [Rhizophlyctis rosea]|nr:hypothetical protein HDV00_006546 [Rhizophlyctis rosea]
MENKHLKLDTLPTELLESISLYIPFPSAFLRTNKRIRAIASTTSIHAHRLITLHGPDVLSLFAWPEDATSPSSATSSTSSPSPSSLSPNHPIPPLPLLLRLLDLGATPLTAMAKPLFYLATQPLPDPTLLLRLIQRPQNHPDPTHPFLDAYSLAYRCAHIATKYAQAPTLIAILGDPSFALPTWWDTSSEDSDDDELFKGLFVNAASWNRGSIISLLVTKYNVAVPNSALCQACNYNHVGLAEELLVRYGCDIGTWNNFPLLTASKKGFVEMVTMLLKHGAGRDDEAVMECLAAAMRRGRSGVVDILDAHLRRERGVEDAGRSTVSSVDEVAERHSLFI